MPINFVKDNRPANSRESVLAVADEDFVRRYDKANLALSKRDLVGIRGDVNFYLDTTVSMAADFAHPKKPIDIVTARAMAWALNVDSDGKLPVFPWGSKVIHGRNGDPLLVATADTINGFVDRHITGQYDMYSTLMAPVIWHAIARADASDAPQFNFVITDGQPHDIPELKRALVESSRRAIWWKFVGVKAVPLLDSFDEGIPGQLVDNIDAKTILEPHTWTDLNYADAMTDELDTWIDAARQKNILV